MRENKKDHFHISGFTLSVPLRGWIGETQKWLIKQLTCICYICFFSKASLSLCQQHASYDSLSCSLYFSIRDSRQPVRLFKLILILYQSIESYQMCHSNEISLAESRKLQLHVVFSLLQLISFFLNFYFWHPEERDIEVHSFEFLSSGILVISYFQIHMLKHVVRFPFALL